MDGAGDALACAAPARWPCLRHVLLRGRGVEQRRAFLLHRSGRPRRRPRAVSALSVAAAVRMPAGRGLKGRRWSLIAAAPLARAWHAHGTAARGHGSAGGTLPGRRLSRVAQASRPRRRGGGARQPGLGVGARQAGGAGAAAGDRRAAVRPARRPGHGHAAWRAGASAASVPSVSSRQKGPYWSVPPPGQTSNIGGPARHLAEFQPDGAAPVEQLEAHLPPQPAAGDQPGQPDVEMTVAAIGVRRGAGGAAARHRLGVARPARRAARAPRHAPAPGRPDGMVRGARRADGGRGAAAATRRRRRRGSPAAPACSARPTISTTAGRAPGCAASARSAARRRPAARRAKSAPGQAAGRHRRLPEVSVAVALAATPSPAAPAAGAGGRRGRDRAAAGEGSPRRRAPGRATAAPVPRRARAAWRWPPSPRRRPAPRAAAAGAARGRRAGGPVEMQRPDGPAGPAARARSASGAPGSAAAAERRASPATSITASAAPGGAGSGRSRASQPALERRGRDVPAAEQARRGAERDGQRRRPGLGDMQRDAAEALGGAPERLGDGQRRHAGRRQVQHHARERRRDGTLEPVALGGGGVARGLRVAQRGGEQRHHAIGIRHHGNAVRQDREQQQGLRVGGDQRQRLRPARQRQGAARRGTGTRQHAVAQFQRQQGRPVRQRPAGRQHDAGRAGLDLRQFGDADPEADHAAILPPRSAAARSRPSAWSTVRIPVRGGRHAPPPARRGRAVASASASAAWPPAPCRARRAWRRSRRGAARPRRAPPARRRVATTGQRCAAASRKTSGAPSSLDGISSASAARYQGAGSASGPSMRNSPRGSVAARASSSPRSGPSPATASGHRQPVGDVGQQAPRPSLLPAGRRRAAAAPPPAGRGRSAPRRAPPRGRSRRGRAPGWAARRRGPLPRPARRGARRGRRRRRRPRRPARGRAGSRGGGASGARCSSTRRGQPVEFRQHAVAGIRPGQGHEGGVGSQRVAQAPRLGGLRRRGCRGPPHAA